MVNRASRWSAADYARNAAFVPALGEPALALLDPQPGELILDLGCGDGALTARIAESGARVIGLDSSPEMVDAARARGIDAFVADAETLGLDGQAERFGRFDAVFSNAALHWMLDAGAVARGVFALLREGGRFVGEMGGAGNLALMRGALRAELEGRGYAVPASDPQWYASVEAFHVSMERPALSESNRVDRTGDPAPERGRAVGERLRGPNDGPSRRAGRRSRRFPGGR